MQRKSEFTIDGPDSLQAQALPLTRLLTTEDVAEIAGLSPETLAQWRWLKKEIPYVRLGTKCVRYRQSDIDAWLAKRLVSVATGEAPERR
jgi:predicted DNA-binding transcriptional regulator AlpA